ncbi:MAG: sulfotransferase [Moraxellaceae bacterium]|jgi:hypothetical protein|nr:sulfotransferase [Moraxellaceae bacterium]
MLQRFGAKLRFEIERMVNRLLALLPRAAMSDAEMHAVLAEHPPLFIVGAPRTGSTALYQILTQVFDVGYIDNLAAHLYGNLAFGLKLSRALGGQGAHDCFESDLGDTSGGGWRAPHECGEFWYRWLSRVDHFVDDGDITPAMAAALRQEVAAATQALGRPLVFKNLNVGQRLRLIRAALPEARILYCRREQAFTVQSILAAREKLRWPEHALWSVRPREWRELESLPLLPQVAGQVVALERQIEADLGRFPMEQVQAVDYERWMESPAAALDGVAALTGWPRRVTGVHRPEIRSINHIRDAARMAEIERALIGAKQARP